MDSRADLGALSGCLSSPCTSCVDTANFTSQELYVPCFITQSPAGPACVNVHALATNTCMWGVCVCVFAQGLFDVFKWQTLPNTIFFYFFTGFAPVVTSVLYLIQPFRSDCLYKHLFIKR